jgi:hypothetical protein
VATTVLDKRKPKLLAHAMAVMRAAMADLGTVAHARVAIVRVTDSLTAVCVALLVRVVISVKTVAHDWAMPLSARSAKPSNVPKCRCANWPHKPTAKR